MKRPRIKIIRAEFTTSKFRNLIRVIQPQPILIPIKSYVKI
jgi:hypothetical protein